MTSQGVDGTVDKAGRILPDSNQRVKKTMGKPSCVIPKVIVFALNGGEQPLTGAFN